MANHNKPESTSPAVRAVTSERSAARAGVLPHVVHLALDVADRGQSTAVAVLDDARKELRLAVDQGLDLAERFAVAAVRFAKKTVSRVDDGAAETLTGVERFLGNAVKSARETTTAAAALASTTAAGVTSPAPHVAQA